MEIQFACIKPLTAAIWKIQYWYNPDDETNVTNPWLLFG